MVDGFSFVYCMFVGFEIWVCDFVLVCIGSEVIGFMSEISMLEVVVGMLWLSGVIGGGFFDGVWFG